MPSGPRGRALRGAPRVAKSFRAGRDARRKELPRRSGTREARRTCRCQGINGVGRERRKFLDPWELRFVARGARKTERPRRPARALRATSDGSNERALSPDTRSRLGVRRDAAALHGVPGAPAPRLATIGRRPARLLASRARGIQGVALGRTRVAGRVLGPHVSTRPPCQETGCEGSSRRALARAVRCSSDAVVALDRDPWRNISVLRARRPTRGGVDATFRCRPEPPRASLQGAVLVSDARRGSRRQPSSALVSDSSQPRAAPSRHGAPVGRATPRRGAVPSPQQSTSRRARGWSARVAGKGVRER